MNIQFSLVYICASMLCYKNACLHFTDKFIYYRFTGDIIPKLICAPGHASIVIVNSWITRHPVCIVQGCPITPYPGFLFTQHYIIDTHSSENPFRCQKMKVVLISLIFSVQLPYIFSGFAGNREEKKLMVLLRILKDFKIKNIRNAECSLIEKSCSFFRILLT
jgi:hypothetical protein